MAGHFVGKFLALITFATSLASAQSVARRKDIPQIAKASNGAIVSIIMSDQDGKPIAQGTGFLVSRDGLILTNYHVIKEGKSAIAKLPDGAFYVVDGVVAFNKGRDIALIKAHGENFPTLALGNSDRVDVGEEVVAIGNPLSLESTVSNGIVSGVRTEEDLGGRFLQITAPISPGSSGGPLFNMDGQVIGITTMYMKGGENLNFAIPINDAKSLLVADASHVKPFPNMPAGDQQLGSASAPADVQIDSPAFGYYKDMLAAREVSVVQSTYACFSNDQASDWFRLIRVMQFGYDSWSVDILNVHKVAVFSILGYEYTGNLKLGANGQIAAAFSSDELLPDGGASEIEKAIHKDDYLEWAADKVSFQFGSYQPPADIQEGYEATQFTMGRASGRYVMTFTPEGNVFDGRLQKLVPFSLSESPHSETGQCQQIPGSKSLEQQLQGSSQ